MRICALTTVDNPYDYFKNPDEWQAYENLTGCRALKMMGRFAFTSDSLSYEQNAKEVERAIDEILKYDYVGTYKKVVRDE